MISEKVQVLIELLKQGNGASAAATDLRAVETQLGKTSEAANRTRNLLAGLFAGVSASFLANEIVQTTLRAEQMNNTLKSVTGSSAGAAREFNFVRQEAGRLGLALDSSVSAYAKLSAAAKGTSLAGQEVKEIFTGIAEAGTVLGLSAAQQEGALQAIQQMISKGTVAAEELRGQLGERLPGAFQIAARAMGVTTQELGKMLEQGQVVAEDFLPKFAEELRRTFSEDASRSANSLNAELNRMKTAFFELKAAIGADSRGLIVTALGVTTQTVQFLTAHKEAIQSLAVVVGILAVEIAALTVVQRANIATTALFGAGWLKSAADVAAASSLIASSTVSMAATVTASFVGIGTAIWAAIEALRMFRAQAQEEASAQALVDQTEMRRKALEKEIDLALQTGRISDTQAVELRGLLSNAWQAEIRKPVSTAAASTGFAEIGTETFDPDIEARRKAMTRVSQVLNPALVTRNEEPAFKSIVQTEAKQEMLRTTEQLRSLQERMFIESLQGLEQEEARAKANYEARERQIDQLHRKLNLGTEELAQMRDLNMQVLEADRAEIRLREQQKAKAEETRRRAELERQANDELQRLEQQLTTEAIGSSETRIQQANREFNARIQLIGRLFDAGKIDADRWNELAAEAANRRNQALAAAVEAGQLEAEKLEAIRRGEDETTIEIKNQFEIRKQNLEAYYAFEMEKAMGNAEAIRALEEKKTADLKQLNAQQRIATDELAQGMIQVGNAAQGQFASGLARAFVSIADGSKSAKEAFADFARNFLRMIAEMILQTLILIAVRMALKSIPGVGAFLSGGGQVNAGGGAANLAAVGGFFESMRRPAIAAAAGVALAASGLEGVTSVNSPTYLPRFNVIAGEAGREVLTVMAKPEVIDVNGIRTIVGNVGTKRMAMMDAEEMLALNRPRMMAEGGFAGMPLPGSAPSSAPAPGGQISGSATVVVALSPELRAAIVRDAIEGAVVRVEQDLRQDSRMSAAVKQLAT